MAEIQRWTVNKVSPIPRILSVSRHLALFHLWFFVIGAVALTDMST